MQESRDGCQSEANQVNSEPEYLTQRREEGPGKRSARRTLLDTSRDFRHRSGSSSVKVQGGEGFIYAESFVSVQNKRAVSEVPRGFKHMLQRAAARTPRQTLPICNTYLYPQRPSPICMFGGVSGNGTTTDPAANADRPLTSAMVPGEAELPDACQVAPMRTDPQFMILVRVVAETVLAHATGPHQRRDCQLHSDPSQWFEAVVLSSGRVCTACAAALCSAACAVDAACPASDAEAAAWPAAS
jgi:hypothetical protein